METDKDGTPPKGIYYPAVAPRLISEMLGLAKGMICDGVVTATLQPLLASADPTTVMQSALRLQTSVCAGATAGRFGQCTALSRELDNAHRAMEAGQLGPARASLTTYLSLLDNAARRDVFDGVEALLLRGNVQMVLARLQ